MAESDTRELRRILNSDKGIALLNKMRAYKDANPSCKMSDMCQNKESLELWNLLKKSQGLN